MKQAEVYHKIVPCPSRPIHFPESVKWLSGEGCGSWFNIESKANGFIIARYSPEGKLECSGIFQQVSGEAVDLNINYEYTYLSHCAEVNIIQNEQKIKFKLISKNI